MKPIKTSERGAAAVELALVLPILLLIVFGIINFGWQYNYTVELRGAIREGARALSLGACATSSSSNCDTSQPYAETIVENALPDFNPAVVSSMFVVQYVGGDSKQTC